MHSKEDMSVHLQVSFLKLLCEFQWNMMLDVNSHILFVLVLVCYNPQLRMMPKLTWLYQISENWLMEHDTLKITFIWNIVIWWLCNEMWGEIWLHAMWYLYCDYLHTSRFVSVINEHQGRSGVQNTKECILEHICTLKNTCSPFVSLLGTLNHKRITFWLKQLTENQWITGSFQRMLFLLLTKTENEVELLAGQKGHCLCMHTSHTHIHTRYFSLCVGLHLYTTIECTRWQYCLQSTRPVIIM